MTATSLQGWRVLVPRGGEWGETVAARLRDYGATAVIAPMINFASTDDTAGLAAALARLQGSQFDWLVVTSATTVDVLVGHGVIIPENT
ncbi:MAG: uroporphyrinogen-III synthase, partial [Salinibacterium sp.]